MSPSQSTITMEEDELDSPSLPALSAHEVIQDFRVIRLLGRGSFASVYLAEQISLGRQVALKVSYYSDSEAKTIAQLEHENIIRVYSQFALPERKLSVINMQYVASISIQDVIDELKKKTFPKLTGKTVLEILDTKIKDKSASVDFAAFRDRQAIEESDFVDWILSIGISLSRALSQAHSKKVLHLDIKPGNILIGRQGRVYLLDFNISADASNLLSGQIPQNFGGTFAYMAPEQANVFQAVDRKKAIQAVNERADIYSLCKILLELLQIHPPPKSMGTEEILAKGITTDPTVRYASAEELAGALEGHREFWAIQKRIPKKGRLLSALSRHPLMGLTLLGAAPQMAAGTIGYLFNANQLAIQLFSHQHRIFEQLNLWYSAVTYTVASVIWGYVLLGLHRSLKNRAALSLENLRKLRADVLRVPLWGAITSILAWLPGTILYPLVLWHWGKVTDLRLLLQVALTFCLSFAVAVSYSFVLHEFSVLSFLYSRLWIGEDSITKRAAKELKLVSPLVKVLSLITVTIPLLSSLNFVLNSNNLLPESAQKTLKLLFVTLILAGTSGVWLAFSLKGRIDKFLSAFQITED